MADETTAHFGLELDDQMSGPAVDAAQALEELRNKLQADTRALKEMQRAMRNLKGGTSKGSAEFGKLKDQIAAQKESIASAQVAMLKLDGDFDTVAKTVGGTGGTVSAFDALLGRTSAMPGPLGAVSSRMSGLKALVGGGGLIASGLLIIAAAFVAMTAAIVAATAALLKYGIAQANAQRAERLRLEALTTLPTFYRRAAGNAQEMQSAIDSAANSTRLGRTELEQYTTRLYRMGLRGEELSSALEGMAIVGAVQGDRWANRFGYMAAAAIRTGKSVDALTERVRNRLGGIALRQMLDLNVQAEKMQENFRQMFGGLRIERFLQKLFDIQQLFSQNTRSGRALKAIMETVFQPMIDGLDPALAIARKFIQGMIIGLLRIGITALRVKIWFDETFGSTSLFSNMDLMRGAVTLGTMAVYTLVAALVVLGVVIAGLAAPFLLAYALVEGVIFVFEKVEDFLQGLDWSELGRSLVRGLIDGMLGMGPTLVESVRGLADSAADALSSALGIQSPSRVFAELGMQVPRGFARGVDAAAPTAIQAVDDMVTAPQVEAGGGRSSSSVSVSVGDIVIHSESGDPEEIAQALRDKLADIFEGVMVEMGT